MTTIDSPISTLATPDHEVVRRAVVPVGVAGFVVAMVFEWFRSDSLGEAVSMTALSVVAAGLLFGLVVPRGLRHESAGGRALGLAIAALVILVPAFWSQLPLFLGLSAMLLGYAGKRASTGSGRCIAALVLGTLAVLGYLGIFIGDWIAHPAG